MSDHGWIAYMERKTRWRLFGWPDEYARICCLSLEHPTQLVHKLSTNHVEERFRYEWIELVDPTGKTYPRFPKNLTSATIVEVGQDQPYDVVIGYRIDKPDPRTIAVGCVACVVDFFSNTKNTLHVSIWTTDQFPWITIPTQNSHY